jgi:uncharacterized protein DUF3179
VFRAEASGKVLDLRPAGDRGGNELFLDPGTGTRWQQATGEAISGPLNGARLARYPFLLTSWAAWRRLHPGTLVLEPLPGYRERMPAVNERILEAAFGDTHADPRALPHDHRLPDHTPVFGLEIRGARKAYPIYALRQSPVVNDELGGQPILIVFQPDSITTTAFSRRWRGRVLRFQAADAAVTELVDAETHSRWNPYGECVAGRLKGARLEPLSLEQEFWFSWSEFFPKTAVFAAER